MQSKISSLCENLLSDITTGENLAITYNGENSQFIRFNNAKVRQAGMVEQGFINLSLVANQRRASTSITISTQHDADLLLLQQALQQLRAEITGLPEDPYWVLATAGQSTNTRQKGRLLDPLNSVEQLIEPMQDMDLTGIWASGPVYRAHFNSAGSQHWFETETFALDYSLVNTRERMLKATFAGTHWDSVAYRSELEASKIKLQQMDKPAIRIKPGKYRAFIASAGVADLINMFSWHGLAEADMQTGESALLRMRQQPLKLSQQFSLSEDFSAGLVPGFNELGEVAGPHLTLIEQGQLKNTLVSSHTAAEFGLISNYATQAENLRAPLMAAGDLAEEDLLKTLGTGVYLSNLHYLNWSDVAAGRITGMTRYACFWVENGEIIGPIENMRFDDSLYHFFGDQLEAVTKGIKYNPDVGTYSGRSLGVTRCPGILVSEFSLTL